MKFTDFFSSCSPSSGKKIKAVKQKYSNVSPKERERERRTMQNSKSQPNLELRSGPDSDCLSLKANGNGGSSKFPYRNGSTKSKSKFYDVCDDPESLSKKGKGMRQNEKNKKSAILENIDNYDLSSMARALDTLKVGSRVVWVREFPGTTVPESGVVLWVGLIENEEIAGIEFDRPLGLGSGWYKRKQLFSCAPDHGGLVAVAGLIREEDLEISPPRIRLGGPSSTGSTGSSTSSASSSLTKSKSSDLKRRSYENIDQIDSITRRSSPKLYEQHPSPNSLKSESSSPCWSSASSGGDLASATQLIPSYSSDKSDYSQGKLRWQSQGQGENRNSGFDSYANSNGHYYHNPQIQTVSYDQFHFDRATPSPDIYAPPDHLTYHQFGDSGCGEYRGRQVQVRETDLDALVMPSVPYIHPPLGEEEIERISGLPKGIQGNCNSCYLDATLFAMFSFTSVFDSILLSDATLRNGRIEDVGLAQETQRILREDIVNPLRKDFLTPAANVMKLRETMYHLDDKLTSEEMDPQEFLQILFHNVLNLEEFISLSSGVSDFFHQVICDLTENDPEQIPTVQQLFEQSLRQQDLKLKSIPTPALILQMPRSGNKYKTYKGILPNLTIDVTDLIENTPRECAICGELATHECHDCYGQFSSTNLNENHSGADSMSFCATCIVPVHNKADRQNHKNIQLIKYSYPTNLYFLPNLSNTTYSNPNLSFTTNHFLTTTNTVQSEIVPSFLNSIPAYQRVVSGSDHHRIPRVTMDLFAVICIETSHFVSFVKCGVDKYAPWVFFDSMADRCESLTGKGGHNIPQVKMLPKMGNWLSRLESQSQEEIRVAMANFTPELKRLVTDPYICLYYSPQASMYI